MTKRFDRKLIFLVLLLNCPLCFSQSTFYDVIKLGSYKVGFCDTVVFCEGVNFKQYNYSGPAPLFVKIWYPLDSSLTLEKLEYNDFRRQALDEPLFTLYQQLSNKMDSSFIWYNISEDFVELKPIDYSPYSYNDVLDSIKTFESESHYKKLTDKLDFPVIIYHHGAQGLVDENFVLAEYFASRGYIVISSTYHLPYDNQTYGYNEFSNDAITKFPKSVTDFGRSLTSDTNIYFIGHSMGAQIGFMYLHEKGWSDAFVSLETTLEFWDSTKIETTWPELNKIMKLRKDEYSMPILMFANTQSSDRFEFYDGIGNTTTIHVSDKEEFGHESYTSGYLMRYFYRDIFHQPDTIELRTQVYLYNTHLQIIEVFLSGLTSTSDQDFKSFENDFFISVREKK